ncbi:DUF742 domain-containing protein [Streptomyces alboflavus]|uniref:DUF742 domain-containing protein n=1 Tax=Streptomyces alboflavus TaxID=67267 RepID=UPI00068E1CFB|nr:DUF742 domain-containing protein [Streptomyces alboflavus]
MVPGTVSEEEYVAATPPDGSSSANWPSGHGQGQGDGSQNRYNFPSAPSHRRQPPYRQPGPQAPGPSPYDQPYAPRIQPVQPQRRSPEPAPAPAASNPLVRPYAMTGGRTRPRYQLAIEALVHTTAQPHQLQGQLPEHQRICNLCREIKSVAEISALLSIPLGVARILVADLAEAGLVAIHQPGGDETAGGQPDVTLLERVLSGLRKL